MRFDAVRARQVAESFDLKALSPDFYANPFPYYHALREHAPVKRMPDGSYLLTRYADVEYVYKNPRLFSSDKHKEFKPKYSDSLLYEHHTTSLVFNDPPLHARVRRLKIVALAVLLFASASVAMAQTCPA
jgi:cytochrome P450